jgi:hypothetical protein
MRSATYHLFRNAILAEKQVVCSYEGRHRELCPHIIGTNKTAKRSCWRGSSPAGVQASCRNGDA